MDGFRQITPELAQQIEKLRQLYNRLFIPILKDSPTMEGYGNERAFSSDIHLFPTQEGSRMPRAEQGDLLNKAHQRNNDAFKRLYLRGGPA